MYAKKSRHSMFFLLIVITYVMNFIESSDNSQSFHVHHLAKWKNTVQIDHCNFHKKNNDHS
jgi:hypothetical protein